MTETPLLDLRGLVTAFDTETGSFAAVNGVDLHVESGETLALVGESGSGKSVTSLSIMGLVRPPRGRIAAGTVQFRGRDDKVRDLTRLPDAEMRKLRGNQIAMIFQEPMTSLNPVYPVGRQIAEVVALHWKVDRAAAWRRAVEMLTVVEIPDPERRAHAYPHQMSGGMRQRVMIAMALACNPSLLIADEPTTALDVTVQAQILALMKRLQAEFRMGILFITHNLGVVAEVADRVAVMYAGRIVETASVDELFERPRHPYTKGLLASLPTVDHAARAGGVKARVRAIPGTVADPRRPAPGCAFAPRCELVRAACEQAIPDLAAIDGGHRSRCLRWGEL